MKNMASGLGRMGWVCILGALALGSGCAVSVEDAESTGTSQAGILGGSNASIGGHPWMVRVFDETPGANHACGGTLITKDWVLTAAHCVYHGPPNRGTGPYGEAQPSALFLIAGDYDSSGFSTSAEGTSWEQLRGASEVHIPSNYVGANHDIALIKLSSSVTLNTRVKVLPLKTGLVTSGTAIAAGWGATAVLNPFDPDKAWSAILQRVDLTIRPSSTCNSALGSIRNLASDELCAGDTGGTRGTCLGDSGGPLLQAVSGGGYQLIGVTSWGDHYCTSYSVFSRVSSHLAWIRSYVPGV
ncbi:MAG: serine protease [Myxococcota bacterium]|nr:serine protease [Myxococcota bacterium]